MFNSLTHKILMFCTIAAAMPMTHDARSQPDRRVPRGPGYHALRLPTKVAEQQQVTTLLETPHLKLVLISLPQGTALETRRLDVPTTIQVLSGSGILRIAEQEELLNPQRMMYVARGMEHSVVPREGSDLLLLVHHMKMLTPPSAGARRGANQ